ncbi:hypothetical protein Hgul01_04781 [Herpetosiphon gulosus]|uniref:Uncharacterized protein n=1 Tax=Herpetosiphon gulosus TaxID=1973496 RepID=A0ABP9X6E3_9CHLR
MEMHVDTALLPGAHGVSRGIAQEASRIIPAASRVRDQSDPQCSLVSIPHTRWPTAIACAECCGQIAMLRVER